MASTGDDADAWKTKGKGGKDIDEKKEKKNEGTNTIKTIRIEHVEHGVINGDHTFNFPAAVEAIVKAIINDKNETMLISMDGQFVVNQMTTRGFGTQDSYNMFVKAAVAWSKGKRSVRTSCTIRVSTNMTFGEILTSDEVKRASSEHKMKLYIHHLGCDEPEAKLIFNVFMVNPYFTNKLDFEERVNNTLKLFVSKAHNDVKTRLNPAFCTYVTKTNDNIIEIGKREWFSEFETDDKGAYDMKATVFTVKCRGDKFMQVKELIKTIKWYEADFGIFKEENPHNNGSDDMVRTAIRHNALCNTGAYVKVMDLPPASLKIKVKYMHMVPDTIEQHIMRKGLEKGEKMFRSINVINKETGLYYITTTKKMLGEAEIFLGKLFEKLNNNKEHEDNLTSIKHQNVKVTIQKRESPSISGSVASKYGREQELTNMVKMDEEMKRELSTGPNLSTWNRNAGRFNKNLPVIEMNGPKYNPMGDSLLHTNIFVPITDPDAKSTSNLSQITQQRSYAKAIMNGQKDSDTQSTSNVSQMTQQTSYAQTIIDGQKQSTNNQTDHMITETIETTSMTDTTTTDMAELMKQMKIMTANYEKMSEAYFKMASNQKSMEMELEIFREEKIKATMYTNDAAQKIGGKVLTYESPPLVHKTKKHRENDKEVNDEIMEADNDEDINQEMYIATTTENDGSEDEDTVTTKTPTKPSGKNKVKKVTIADPGVQTGQSV
jgi:hypothetical protein